MPPNAPKGLNSSPKPEDALKKLLTLSQLLELDALINDITSAMRVRLIDVFDTSYKTSQGVSHLLDELEHNPNVSTERGEEASSIDGRADVEAPESTALKNDAIEFFQLWRDDITARIVEAATSTSDEEVEEAEAEAASTEKAPAPDKPTEHHINTEHSNAMLSYLYPPTRTPLSALSHGKRESILSAFLLFLLSKGYPSYSRVLMLHLTSSLALSLHALTTAETTLAHGLVEAAKHLSATAETTARSESSAISRRWKVGLAGVAGAALIGVTGGLAAPLVAAGIGTIMGGIGLGGTLAAGLLGAISGSGIIVGSLFGAYGYGMTSKMMLEYAKEVEDFAFIPLKGGRRRNPGEGVQDVDPQERRLRVTIGISGWLTQKRDVITPWRVLGQSSEVFALRWELDSLLKMGKSLESVVSSAVWTVASTEIISRTVFASLMFALWPIGLLKISKIVDNPFTVAKNRADKAGLVLADALINKAQGERPVTLIGYSMGARVIYSCLMSLAERRAFGLVESAVLIGAPTPSDAKLWRALRSVVAGRLVNVYAEKDYILAFLYRTSSIQYGIAGLQEVRDVKGVENVDVTAMVSGHLRYQHLVGSTLEKSGWEDVNIDEVKKEEMFIAMLDEEETKVREKSLAVEPDLISFGDDPDPPTTKHARPLPAVSKASDDLLAMLMGSDEVLPGTVTREPTTRNIAPEPPAQYSDFKGNHQEQSGSEKQSNNLLGMLMEIEKPESQVPKKYHMSESLSTKTKSDERKASSKGRGIPLRERSTQQHDDPLLFTAGKESHRSPIHDSTTKNTSFIVLEEHQQPHKVAGKKFESRDEEECDQILMEDNDDTGITILEPVAIDDDTDPWEGWNQK